MFPQRCPVLTVMASFVRLFFEIARKWRSSSTGSLWSQLGSSNCCRPSVSSRPSGRGGFKKASGKPMAGMKSGMNGRRGTSRPVVDGVYLLIRLNSSATYARGVMMSMPGFARQGNSALCAVALGVTEIRI